MIAGNRTIEKGKILFTAVYDPSPNIVDRFSFIVDVDQNKLELIHFVERINGICRLIENQKIQPATILNTRHDLSLLLRFEPEKYIALGHVIIPDYAPFFIMPKFKELTRQYSTS